MIEAVEGLRFIDTTLRNNAPFMATIPGGLWRDANTSLPQGVFPDQIFCVYQWHAGKDEVAGGGIRVGVDELFLAKIIGPGSDITDIETAADLMDSLLQGATGTTATGTIYYLIRQQEILLPQLVNARLALQVGGQYRSFLQKT